MIEKKIPENGYLYLANGEKYIQEAIVSAKSLKELNETAHVTLISNRAVAGSTFDLVKIKDFDEKNDLKFLFRVENIYNESPYQNTIALDTDTYFCDNCDELFKFTKKYDISMVPAPLTKKISYNTGLIVFSKNPRCENLFAMWLKKYRENGGGDQQLLTQSITESKTPIGSLPIIYNARINFYLGLNSGIVKIIHGRDNDIKKIRESINKSIERRCWLPTIKDIII